jgi:hypothetical protein
MSAYEVLFILLLFSLRYIVRGGSGWPHGGSHLVALLGLGVECLLTIKTNREHNLPFYPGE